MKAEWQKVRLGDVVTTNTSLYSEKENWPFVNYLDTGNISENRIEQIQTIDTQNEKLPSRARRKVNVNDIVYSTVRPIQRHYGILKNIPENFLVSTGFTTISPTEYVDSAFIYYFLTQNEIVAYLQTLAEQTVSTYPSIKASDIEDLQINLPPLPTQRAIAATLSCLDDKIELNHRINANLEAQAQALFKRWFVDSETSDICQLSELFTFVKGKKPFIISETLVDGYLPYLTIDAMTSNVVSFADLSKMVIAKPDDILMVMDGASSGTVYFGKNGIVGSTFALVNMKDSSMREAVFQALKFYENEIKQHNTGSAIPHADKRFILQLKFPLPENISESNAIFADLRQEIIRNTEESVCLAAIRDALLPRLMSGEIEVEEK